MISLDDLKLMDAFKRHGSLSAAARFLNLTPPALSMRLKKLEQKLGLALIVRSSRAARLTDEGERLTNEAQVLLAQIEALPETLLRDGRRLSGRLRVAAPFGFGRLHVAPLVARFAQIHPSMQINLDLLETPWSTASQADIVVHIGGVRDSSWVAHVLARNERWVCASRAYLRTHGVPAMPGDLIRHSCLCIRENEEDVTLWRYRRATRRPAPRARLEAVRVNPTLTSNDGQVVRDWAVAGLGIALRSQWDVAPLVKTGKLQRVFTDYDFEAADVLALVPVRHGISARVAQFVGFLKENLTPMSI